MSQLPKNFEKIALGVGGVAALAFATLGFLRTSAVSNDFSSTVTAGGGKEVAVPEAEATARAVSSLTSNRNIVQASQDGRDVDLFVGIPLFADKNNPNVPVDPVQGRPVHPPIPNSWWIETGADMTYSNSPHRDDDGDGFTNLEEFEAKTHPMDPKSIPPLIHKLAYVRDESTKWYVLFGLESQNKWSPRFLGFTPDGKKLENRVPATAMLEVGDTFFKDGAMANRFRFTGLEEREVTSERTNLAQRVRIALYEDLKANKRGEKYESQAGLPEAELESKAYHDRIAVFDLQAIGYEGQEFKVEERVRFALPPDAEEKNCLLKKVTPTSVEVEFTDPSGKTTVIEIKKGGTP